MPPARSKHAEILDNLSPTVTSDELQNNLRDIRRSNRLFGGTRVIVDAVSAIAHDMSPCSLLDLATGSADIPAALIRGADREGWDLRIVATDLQPQVLAVARAYERPQRLSLQQADARALPYKDGSFDIATLSLALHHFESDEAINVLAEMRRVSRRYLIVSDLARSWPGYAGAWLFGNVLTRNRVTRHDAPLSARRAYTPEEALRMARAAGWRDAKVKPVFPFRYLLAGRP